MILTVQKENKIYRSNSVSESFKVFVVNKSKEIKIKNLKESDKLLGGFSVIGIEKSLVENKKQENIYFVVDDPPKIAGRYTRPEAKVIYPWAGWSKGKTLWRTEQ